MIRVAVASIVTPVVPEAVIYGKRSYLRKFYAYQKYITMQPVKQKSHCELFLSRFFRKRSKFKELTVNNFTHVSLCSSIYFSIEVNIEPTP